MLCAKKPWGVFMFLHEPLERESDLWKKTVFSEAKFLQRLHDTARPNAKTNHCSTDIVVGGGGKCGGEQATIDEVLPNNHLLINTVNVH